MNPFEALAEKQIVSPRKSQMKAVETRRSRALAKKQAEGDILHKLWKKWHAERCRDLLKVEGAAELIAFVERMTLNDAEALIDLVEHSPLRHADADARFLALGIVDRSIIYLREKAGLMPISDSIPWLDEPPTVFEVVKSLLNGEV